MSRQTRYFGLMYAFAMIAEVVPLLEPPSEAAEAVVVVLAGRAIINTTQMVNMMDHFM